jgi:HPt (histidine-containing phosphotransfer) domain-containing protein
MSEAGLDLQGLLQRVGGDRELLAEIAVLFTDQVPEWTESLRGAIAAGDATAVFQVAHRVAGAAAYLGGGPVREAAKELEAMGRASDLSGAAAVFGRLEAGLRTLARALAALPPAG